MGQVGLFHRTASGVVSDPVAFKSFLLDETTGGFLVWDGSAWVPVPISGFTAATAPARTGCLSRITDSIRGLVIGLGSRLLSLFIHVNVSEFVTGGSGTTEDPWTGWEVAFANGARRYQFEQGYYLWTSTLAITAHWTKLYGAGRGLTFLRFNPTADDTGIEVRNGSSEFYGFELRGLTIETTNSTYAKIGVDLVDCRHVTLADFQIGANDSWTGGVGGSAGLRLRGRDRITLERFGINADIPIDIAENPNNSIDLDHCTMRDYELNAIGMAYPCIRGGSGLSVSNLISEGSGAWTKGSDGFSWVSTVTPDTACANIQLRGVRWEQSTNPTGRIVTIDHNTYPVYGLVLQNIYGGVGTCGLKFRGCENVSLDDVRYVGFVPVTPDGSGDALDIDSTVRYFEWENCLWQAGSTATITGQRTLIAFPKYPNTAPLGASGSMDSVDNISKEVESEAAWQGVSVYVTADAAVAIGDASAQGFLFVDNDEGSGALFYLRPATAAYEISDPVNAFSAVQGTDDSVNIYFDTDAFYIQNTFAGDLSVRYFRIGGRSDGF